MVIAAEADEIAEHGRAAVGVKNQVVDLVDPLSTSWEATVHISDEHRPPQCMVQHPHLRKHRHQLSAPIDQQRPQ